MYITKVERSRAEKKNSKNSLSSTLGTTSSDTANKISHKYSVGKPHCRSRYTEHSPENSNSIRGKIAAPSCYVEAWYNGTDRVNRTLAVEKLASKARSLLAIDHSHATYIVLPLCRSWQFPSLSRIDARPSPPPFQAQGLFWTSIWLFEANISGAVNSDRVCSHPQALLAIRPHFLQLSSTDGICKCTHFQEHIKNMVKQLHRN